MSTTPFLRKLSSAGGTFYTCSSSAEDLSLTFNNSTSKFVFSKFALLNIPRIQTPVGWANTIQFSQPDSAFLDAVSGDPNIVTGDPGIDLAQSFQSYCLNLENTIISDPGYNKDLKQNVSERVFFKWLKEIGAIRHKVADPSVVSSSLDQNTISLIGGYRFTQKRFVEGDPSNSTGVTGYNSVVKYIGEIDVVNSVQNSDNAYSEVYIHVPTKDGATPTVLFKSINDVNYHEDQTWYHHPIDPLNNEYLQGRNYNDLNPSGLTNLAIFDDKVAGSPTASVYYPALGATASGSWYSPREIERAYYTELDFFSPVTQKVTKTYNSQTKEFNRSTLDGISIDFDPKSYQQIISDTSLSGNSIMEFNSVSYSTDFEFNTVLIYYDVYDPNNRTDSATNLYGVLFLDNVSPTSGGAGELPSFKKYRPSAVTGLNGNSYGYKLNLKFDTDIDQTGIEKAINDYSPYSLELFSDALNVLQKTSSVFLSATATLDSLSKRVNYLENLLFTQETLDSINTRLAFLENSFSSAKAIYENSSQITDLIAKNQNDINLLTQNKTSLNVAYNTDTIVQGQGIRIDKSVKNQVRIDSIGQEFNIGDNNGLITLSQNVNNIIPLRPFSNYIKHINNGIDINLQKDLIILIDDSTNVWSLGQSLRISFGDSIFTGDYKIIILTNSLGNYPISNPSGSRYSTVLGVLGSNEFGDTNGKPVFEVVCTDNKNLVFNIDRIGQSIN